MIHSNSVPHAEPPRSLNPVSVFSQGSWLQFRRVPDSLICKSLVGENEKQNDAINQQTANLRRFGEHCTGLMRKGHSEGKEETDLVNSDVSSEKVGGVFKSTFSRLGCEVEIYALSSVTREINATVFFLYLNLGH